MSAEPAGTGPTPWSVADEPARDATDLKLFVVVGAEGCRELHGVQVDETDEHVAIDARVRSVSSGPCRLSSRNDQVSVALRAPLGDRQLVGCDPNGYDDDCRRVNYQRLDPANF